MYNILYSWDFEIGMDWRKRNGTYTLNFAEHPTSRSLTYFEWRNAQGKKERFRLKELICYKWKELGCLLEIPLPIIISWEKKYREDAIDSVNAVLCHWLENPTNYYPISWEGLEKLLFNAQLGQVAEDLKRARSNAC